MPVVWEPTWPNISCCTSSGRSRMVKVLAGASALGTACRPESAWAAIMKGARRLVGATTRGPAGGRLRSWRWEDENLGAPPRELCPTWCPRLFDRLESHCPGQIDLIKNETGRSKVDRGSSRLRALEPSEGVGVALLLERRMDIGNGYVRELGRPRWRGGSRLELDGPRVLLTSPLVRLPTISALGAVARLKEVTG